MPWLLLLAGAGVALTLLALAGTDHGLWGRRPAVSAQVLEVPMKWGLWGSWMIGIAAAALAFAYFTRLMWWDEDRGYALLMALLSAGACYLGFGVAVFGVAAERTGYVFRLDAGGLRHCLLPSIPWAQIRHFELEESKNEKIGTSVFHLRVALEYAGVEALLSRRWLRRVVIAAPAVDEYSRSITIHLAWADREPHQLLAAAVGLRRQYQPERAAA